MLKEINIFRFVKQLKRMTIEMDTRVVFFLGAGCSISSNIKAAGELTKEWIRILHYEDSMGDISLQEWINNSNQYKEYSDENAAKYYSAVIGDLFHSEEERQKKIESLIADKYPGFAYAVFAKLMGHPEYGKVFNKVLTTNFDDLVADALYLYSNKKPLVITHESLMGYTRISSIKPTVIKLHGDAHFAPKNTGIEVRELHPLIHSGFKKVLEEPFLVFLGYGGNDEGILNSLTNITELKGKVYWINDHLPANKFGKWLEKIDAVWVNHLDFDLLMMLIHKEFMLDPPDTSKFYKLTSEWNKTFLELKQTIESNQTPEAKKRFYAVFDDLLSKLKDWSSLEIKVERNEKEDSESANNIFRRGFEIIHEEAVKEAKQKEMLYLFANHELRSPINSIKSIVERLSKGQQSYTPAKWEQMLKDLLSRAQLVEKRLNNTLLFPLSEQVKPTSESFIIESAIKSIAGDQEKVNINEIINEIIHTRKSNKKQIVYKTEKKTCYVSGHKESLFRIFENVIDNAIKYSNPETTIEISFTEKKYNYYWSILSVGIGVPMGEELNIFKLKYRGSNAITLNASGAGLGLYYSSEFARLHKGSIELKESKPLNSSENGIRNKIYRTIFQILLPKNI